MKIRWFCFVILVMGLCAKGHTRESSVEADEKKLPAVSSEIQRQNQMEAVPDFSVIYPEIRLL